MFLEVIRTTAAAAAGIFACVSPEHSYSAWHRIKSNMSNKTTTTSASDLNEIERNLRPLHWHVATDNMLRRHPRWEGPLKADSASISVLALRWLLLHAAMMKAEEARGSRYQLVLRMRPDALLPCILPQDPAILLAGYSAVADKDVVLLMRREASNIALTAYTRASGHSACALKCELCVPALLLQHGLSVGNLRTGVAIVRPEAVCQAFKSRPATVDSSLSCGREYLAMRKPPCSQSPSGPWNLTQKVLFWRARRRGGANHIERQKMG